jgi:hypothetical protein
MSALGQKQTFAVQKSMSALLLKATVKADILGGYSHSPDAGRAFGFSECISGRIADFAISDLGGDFPPGRLRPGVSPQRDLPPAWGRFPKNALDDRGLPILNRS